MWELSQCRLLEQLLIISPATRLATHLPNVQYNSYCNTFDCPHLWTIEYFNGFVQQIKK